jgi:hypothetical protein
MGSGQPEGHGHLYVQVMSITGVQAPAGEYERDRPYYDLQSPELTVTLAISLGYFVCPIGLWLASVKKDTTHFQQLEEVTTSQTLLIQRSKV